MKALRRSGKFFGRRPGNWTRGSTWPCWPPPDGRGSQRLYHVMQTLGATGIRVSELVFVTVEALAAGRALVHCKGKRRRFCCPKNSAGTPG